MNRDHTLTDQVDATQWEAMVRGWRLLLAWEIVVTVLTVVMARQHLGLAIAVAIIDLAAVAQTLQVAKAWSTSRAGEMHPRASVTTGLDAAALNTVVGAIVAVATVL